VRLVDLLGDPGGIGPFLQEPAGDGESSRPRVRVPEGPGVGQDRGVEVDGHVLRDFDPHPVEQPEHHLARGACLRVRERQVAVAVIRNVVVDVDDPPDFCDTRRLVSHALDLAAVQDEDGVEAVQGAQPVHDHPRVGKERVDLRRAVLVVDDRLLAKAPERLVEGQLGAHGIPVEPHVGGDEKAAAFPYDLSDPVDHPFRLSRSP